MCCLRARVRVYSTDMTRFFNSLTPVLVAALACWPETAAAHAGDQGFVLLLPTTFYTITGTLSVVASMVLVTCLRRGVAAWMFTPRSVLRLPSAPEFRVVGLTSVFATVFLMVLIGIGLWGPNDPQNNLLPLTFWTLWWMMLYTVQGTLFDVWRWINPWTGIAKLIGVGDDPPIRVAGDPGVWPAIGLFVLFQGFLLADIAPSDPKRLAYIVLVYWGLTFIGIALFGRRFWLRHVECITVLFNLLSLLRPLEITEQVRIGLPGWRAVQDRRTGLSLSLLCLTVLAAGSFDGVNETFWWLVQIGINPLEFPGRSAVVNVTLFGLGASIALLVAVYAVAVWVGVRAARGLAKETDVSFAESFRAFAITLLPIALGYHVAHYLVSFLVQIRVTLSTAADPLARGWDLFGLSAVKVTTGFLNTPETVKVIWLSQAGVVILSHILAVLMCHQIAERTCRSAKGVILIQAGISILMIAYTVFGLWLLASPRGA